MRIVGPVDAGREKRVPTISFVVRGERSMSSKSIVEAFDKTEKVCAFPLHQGEVSMLIL